MLIKVARKGIVSSVARINRTDTQISQNDKPTIRKFEINTLLPRYNGIEIQVAAVATIHTKVSGHFPVVLWNTTRIFLSPQRVSSKKKRVLLCHLKA